MNSNFYNSIARLRPYFDPLRPLLAALNGWNNDRCASMAAALAFYAGFSLAPMLVIVIATAGFFFGPEAVQGRLFSEISGLLGPEGASAVQAMVASAWKSGRSGWTTLISLIAIFIGASATFTQLSDSLNFIWRVQPPTTGAIFSLVRIRLVSFGLVIGIGFLIVVLLVLDAALSFAVEHFLNDVPRIQSLAKFGQRGVVFALLCAAFAFLLKVLPDRLVQWRNVMVGAVTAAILFSIGKNLFGIYLVKAGTADSFGAAGSLAVLLMWLYFSSAVFLLGAEIAAKWSREDERVAQANVQEGPVNAKPS